MQTHFITLHCNKKNNDGNGKSVDTHFTAAVAGKYTHAHTQNTHRACQVCKLKCTSIEKTGTTYFTQPGYVYAALHGQQLELILANVAKVFF